MIGIEAAAYDEAGGCVYINLGMRLCFLKRSWCSANNKSSRPIDIHCLNTVAHFTSFHLSVVPFQGEKAFDASWNAKSDGQRVNTSDVKDHHNVMTSPYDAVMVSQIAKTCDTIMRSRNMMLHDEVITLYRRFVNVGRRSRRQCKTTWGEESFRGVGSTHSAQKKKGKKMAIAFESS